MHGSCDCVSRGLFECCSTNNYSFYENKGILLGCEYEKAMRSCESDDRGTNNLQRKKLYKACFHAMDFGPMGEGERRKLPTCLEAKIRQIYPSETGLYMGYREN